MKILFICHRIPYPPNKGDKLRAFHFIKHLSKKHDIYLVSLFDDSKDERYDAALRKYCREVHLFYLNRFFSKLKAILWMAVGYPASLGYFYSRRLARKIKELTEKTEFDAAFVYSSSMAQYASASEAKVRIIDFVDCDSSKWKQYAQAAGFPSSFIYRKEHLLLREYERKVSENFDALLTVSENERKEFSAFIDVRKITVIMNGVDTEFFRPVPYSGSKRITFTGAMDYFANVSGVVIFCKEVFPIIREKIPDAEFYIIGPRPVREIRRLSAQDGVFVTGAVEDLRDYFRTASVSVVPSFRIAQGLQNKILEPMASALPVVTTSRAIDGLKMEPDRDILIADDTKTFADKVIMVLSDSVMSRSIGANARRYVETNHDWQRNMSGLDKIIEGLL